MGKTLEALRQLQDVERQLTEVRQAEERRQRQVRVHKRNIAKCRERIGARKAELRSHQMEVDRLDLDVKERESILAKHREALNRARTNKEYASILTVINTEKVDSAKLENRVLRLMSQMDAIRADIKKDEDEQAVHQERLAEAERQLREYLDGTAERRAALEAQRTGAAEDIPQQALALFNRNAERREGEALAEVVRLHPKRDDYACGGCNMKVPLESVNVLRTRDELSICNACGRILYLNS